MTLYSAFLDDGDGQTGADIFNRGTVLLRLLDRRVHKHGAAAAQVHGLVGKQAQRGKLLDVVAQRLGERLQKLPQPEEQASFRKMLLIAPSSILKHFMS